MNGDDLDEIARVVRKLMAQLNEAADALTAHVPTCGAIREQQLTTLTAEVRDGVLSGSPEAHDA